MRPTSDLAGKTVKIRKGKLSGLDYKVEDWWENVYGKSWMVSDGNPAAMKYAMRTGLQAFGIPNNDDVLYGKIGLYGELVHTSEL